MFEIEPGALGEVGQAEDGVVKDLQRGWVALSFLPLADEAVRLATPERSWLRW